MKVLIVGSRSIQNFDLSHYVPPDTSLVISGGAKGVDTIAEIYADTHHLSKLIVRPRYDLYGKIAPLKRNKIMVDIADAVIVVWDGVSRGTNYTLKYAENKNKPITLIRVGHTPA